MFCRWPPQNLQTGPNRTVANGISNSASSCALLWVFLAVSIGVARGLESTEQARRQIVIPDIRGTTWEI